MMLLISNPLMFIKPSTAYSSLGVNNKISLLDGFHHEHECVC